MQELKEQTGRTIERMMSRECGPRRQEEIQKDVIRGEEAHGSNEGDDTECQEKGERGESKRRKKDLRESDSKTI